MRILVSSLKTSLDLYKWLQSDLHFLKIRTDPLKPIVLALDELFEQTRMLFF